MTTGSWNRDSFVPFGTANGWIGVKTSKTWTGQDRSISPDQYPQDPMYVVKRMYDFERDMELQRFKELRFQRRKLGLSRPPSRVRDEEHSYSASWTRLSDERVDYFAAQAYANAVHAVFGHPNFSLENMLTTADQYKLINKLRDEINGSDFNMAVFTAELHPAMRMITDSATRIYKSLRSLRRGNVIDAAHALVQGTVRYKTTPPSKSFSPKTKWGKEGISDKDMSQRWLELQYGWKPLLKDVEAGAEFLAHSMLGSYRTVYRATRRLEKDLTQQTYSTVGWGNPPSPPYTPITPTVTKIHRRHIKAIISELPSVEAKLGLLNPETVAWELMPYSFVVDWFIPIGQWMESRAFARSLTGKYVTTDVRTALRHPISSRFFTPKNPRAFQIKGDLTRTISTSLDVPMPWFKPLSSVPSWTRMGNAIALLVTGQKNGFH